MKKLITLSLFFFSANYSFSQSDTTAIKNVMLTFQKAIEKLDTTGTIALFTDDSKIYESGGVEGNYKHYAEHHLASELLEFKSFTYSDYKTSVKVESNYAFVTETYKYEIVLKEGNQKITRKGVATSVLRKENGKWLIWISHNSSRK